MKRTVQCSSISIVSLALVLCCGCGDDDGGGGGGDGELSTYVVTGSVADFETGEPLDVQTTVATAGLAFEGIETSVSGADFTISGIAPGSLFQLLVGASGYQQTYTTTVEVAEDDVSNVAALVVGSSYLSTLADDFGVSASATKGVVIARLVDGAGLPVADVDAEDISINDGQTYEGPFFLDEDLAAAPLLTASSSSGYIVYFEVDPGQVTLSSADEENIGIQMPVSPVDGATVTLAEAVVDGEAVVLPTDVSFSGDVIPIFEARSCTACHAQGGPGKLTAGLHLNGGENVIHKELTEDVSATHGVIRIDRADPEESLLLTMPGPAEDAHNTTFPNTQDPDYLTIRVWIEEGALNN